MANKKPSFNEPASPEKEDNVSFSPGRKPHGLVDSFRYALDGIVHSVIGERNLRIDFGGMIAVFVAAVALHLDLQSWLWLIAAAAAVLSAELMNTGMERAVDLVTSEYRPLAKLAKDAAAGAVLVTAIGAAVIGVLVFYHVLADGVPKVVRWAAVASPLYAVGVVVVSLAAAVLGKTFSHARNLAQGGMPSAHAAMAFAAATAVIIVTRNAVAGLLAVFCAILVAESRWENRVHTVWELLSGAALGCGVAWLLFALLW